MNLKQVEALVYLSRHGTFKDAARALYHESDTDEYVTPEALQYRIRGLEREVGVSLYEKRQGTARVTLTREGHLFLPEAITLYQRMRRWQAMFSESTRGKLTLAATEVVILHRLPEIIRQFHERFPQINLVMRAVSPEETESQVRQGEVDFGLATHPPESDDLEYVLWRRSQLVAVAPRGHELAHRRRVTLHDLAKHPLIILAPDPSHRDDRERIDDAFREAGIRHVDNVVLETSTSEIIKRYVENGLGIGIVAETSVLNPSPSLEVIDLQSAFGQTEVGVLVRREKVITAPMRELFRLFSDHIADWVDRRSELPPLSAPAAV